MQMRNMLMGVAALLIVLPAAAHAAPRNDEDYVYVDESSFQSWLNGFRSEASAEGIRSDILDRALTGIAPNERVIELDRKQPEGTMTMDEYMKKVLPQSRIDKARRLYDENRELLERIASKYGVQSQYIVALWGIESNFGERMGDYNIVESLATLAFEGRRHEFFKKELMKALHILNDGHILPDEMVGSWAGAMGQCQFMPSSFLRYAVDENGDGRKDIWQTQEDVFASIANYLKNEGWDDRKGWGTKKHPKDNFNVLLKWNRSRYFATAVGTLANSIK